MRLWIRHVYILILKQGMRVEDIGVFPGSFNTNEFAIFLGGMWESDLIDVRYRRVQEHIDKLKRAV